MQQHRGILEYECLEKLRKLARKFLWRLLQFQQIETQQQALLWQFSKVFRGA